MTAGKIGRGLSACAGKRRPPNGRRERGEMRRLAQLAVCAGIFFAVVVMKITLPQGAQRVGEDLRQMNQRSIDVQSVFSAIAKAASGQSDLNGAMNEVYQAVFHPVSSGEVSPADLEVLLPKEENSWQPESWQKAPPSEIRDEEEATAEEATAEETPADEAAEQQGETSASQVSYANLPEGVRMEQAPLGFAYTTPTQGTLSSAFGYRDHPIEGEERFHYGIDIAADTGTEVSCFADGTVSAVGESSTLGKYVMIAHDNNFTTLYAHCSKTLVSSGTSVSRGETIAQVGQTGMATGPHLHFELHEGGEFLNPIYYVTLD